MQKKQQSREIKRLRKTKLQWEINEFLSEIASLSSFKQQAACELYAAELSELSQWSNDKRTLFITAFEEEQVPSRLNENLRILKSVTNMEYRYAFYLQIPFIVGITTGLFPYAITGLQEIIKLNIAQDSQKATVDHVFSWILFLSPIIIFLILLILRHRMTKSMKFKLINSKEKAKQERRTVKSEGQMRNS